MHTIIKSNFCLLVAAMLLAVSCRKVNDLPASPHGTGKLTVLQGNNQSGVFGELLPDTIKLAVTSRHPSDHFWISYRYVQGNGQLMQNTYLLTYPMRKDSAGTLFLNWRMGCNSTTQQVRFYVYTDSLTNNYYDRGDYYSAPSDSVTITATAVKPSGWCRSCGYPQTGVASLINNKINSDNGKLYMVAQALFTSDDGGLNWYPISGIPYSDEVIDVQFNSMHWAYVLTQDHGLYFSKDMKQWEPINNGLLDMRQPTSFLVEDSAMFVSFYSDGPYRTTDNGNFWKKLVVGGISERFYYIRRHPDGRLMLFDEFSNFLVSADNGDTWKLVFIDYKYVNNQVFDFKIAPDGRLYIGAENSSLAIIDPNTYQGDVHSYPQYNSNEQTINNITITGDNVYYLVNYSSIPGIYSESNSWKWVDIGFNGRIDYYYLKENNKYLVDSDGWVYYHD
jgi:hypothetical protein